MRVACAVVALCTLASAAKPTTPKRRIAEECEACGLIVWRMQTIVSKKQEELKPTKKAKEKAATKTDKHLSKRWIREEYSAELAEAIDEQIAALPKDGRLMSGACRPEETALGGSALRGSRFDNAECKLRVEERVTNVAALHQDELTAAVIEGKGASVCAAVLAGCTADRAKHLLGSQYAEDLDARELEMLQVGYSDEWTLHTDIDDSVYWFSRSRMKSQREPPPGWMKHNGKWQKGVDDGAHDEL